MKVSGRCKVLYTDETVEKNSGRFKVDVKKDINEISASGNIKCGDLSGLKIKLKGKIIADNLLADKVKVAGNISANTIKGKEIKLKLSGRNNIDVISGNDIKLSKDEGDNLEGFSSLFGMIIGKKMQFPAKEKFENHVKNIHGNNIEIENTISTLIEGNVINIGDECKILEVRYKDTLNVSSNSSVGKIVKIS